MLKEIVYHGTYFKSLRKFNLNYLEDGEHSFGIGIYFTKNKEVLNYYSCIDDYKGIVLKTELNIKKEEIRNYTDTLTEIELKKLLKKLRITLTEKEIYDCLNKDMTEIHFYILNLMFKNDKLITRKCFLKKFVKATKIKVIKKIEPFKNFIREDFCVMDPRCLKIKTTIDLNKNKEFLNIENNF